MLKKEVISFSFSIQGYSHIRQEKVCEDFSGSLPDNMNLQLVDNSSIRIENRNEINKMRICIVADGHGSDNYPRANKGSEFAVKAAKESIVELLNSIKMDELEEMLENDIKAKGEKENLRFKNLAKMILKKWHYYINNDFEIKNFSNEELEKVDIRHREKYEYAISKYLDTNKPSNEIINNISKAYGTTLVCFVTTEKFCFGLQIGDGKCVMLRHDGTFCEPIPWDDNCEGNVTTSLSDTDAIDNDEFRFYFSNEIPVAVFCGSDGVDDSYKNTDDLHSFYRWVCMNFIDSDLQISLKRIEEYLPIMSKGGSADDISIAGIVDIGTLKSIKDIIYSQAESYAKNKKVSVDIQSESESKKSQEEQKTQEKSNFDALKKIVEDGEKDMLNNSFISIEEKEEYAEKADMAIENLEHLKNDTITKETN